MTEEERHALLLLHRDTIRRFVRRLPLPSGDADDLAQDLAIVVLAHPTGPPDPERFVAWCCGVARNLAAHRRRSEIRRRLRDEDDTGFAEARDFGRRDNPEAHAIARQRLAMKLDHISSAGLRLLRDRFVLEETSEEIAQRLRVSSASIRMRIARLLAALRVEKDTLAELRADDRYDSWPRGNNE